MLPPASGTGLFYKRSAKIIRLVKKGCTNRPFFHVVVTERRRHQYMPVIEQLGTYDPLPNEHNEKLVSLNFERIRFWIGNGALVSKPAEQIFGLSGFFPIHPSSYLVAFRNRQATEQAENQTVDEKEKAQSTS